MRCKIVRKHLYDYLDGLLGERKGDGIRTHLSSCETCRLEEDDARLLRDALASLADVPPPEDGLHRLETRLAFLPPFPAAARPGRLRTFVLPYTAGLATAAAILLAFLPLLTGASSVEPKTGPGVEDAVAGSSDLDLLPNERELRPVEYVYDDDGNLFELPAKERSLYPEDMLERLRIRAQQAGYDR